MRSDKYILLHSKLVKEYEKVKKNKNQIKCNHIIHNDEYEKQLLQDDYKKKYLEDKKVFIDIFERLYNPINFFEQFKTPQYNIIPMDFLYNLKDYKLIIKDTIEKITKLSYCKFLLINYEKFTNKSDNNFHSHCIMITENIKKQYIDKKGDIKIEWKRNYSSMSLILNEIYTRTDLNHYMSGTNCIEFPAYDKKYYKHIYYNTNSKHFNRTLKNRIKYICGIKTKVKVPYTIKDRIWRKEINIDDIYIYNNILEINKTNNNKFNIATVPKTIDALIKYIKVTYQDSFKYLEMNSYICEI